MIEFIEAEDRVKAYFANPLTEERRLIGSCEMFVGEEAIAYWRERISTGYYGQISEVLALLVKFPPRGKTGARL